jgi:hypothetical protein
MEETRKHPHGWGGRPSAARPVPAPPADVRTRLLAVLTKLDRRSAIIVGACLIVLAGLGGLYYQTGTSVAAPFDFDGEQNISSGFATALLLCAATAAVASSRATWARRPLVLVGLAVFFTYMAVDEFAELHERMGQWTGIGERARETPILLAGGLLWLATLAQLRRVRPAMLAFVAGGAAWVVAQGLEKIELAGTFDSAYGFMALVEETLEPLGSALFVAAFAIAARAASATAAPCRAGVQNATLLPDEAVAGATS